MINYKKISGLGVVGYGSYVPRMRIEVGEIAAVHGVDAKQVEKNLGIKRKSVADWDEDTATMAYMASRRAIEMAGIGAERLGAIYVGSESHPYTVKPTSTILGEALGVGNWYIACDLEFACKAATAGVQMLAGLILSGFIDYGLVVGADKAQSEPKDALEYSAGAGAAALILGRRKILARVKGFVSYTSDTNDFWRRSEQKYPKHAGRFTGEPAYFQHVIKASKKYLGLSKTSPESYDHVVFHMPNGKFPEKVARILGFKKKQLEKGCVVAEIGNPYSASSLTGLCRVLEKAGVGEKILITAYGSGAGADTLALETTPLLVKRQTSKKSFYPMAIKKINYGEYRALQD